MAQFGSSLATCRNERSDSKYQNPCSWTTPWLKYAWASADAVVTVVDEGSEVYLESRLPAEFDNVRLGIITGSDLERVRFVDAEFEECDGSPALLATDLVGLDKAPPGSYPAGPIATLASGLARTRLW